MAAAFCGADWFFPRVFAAACAATSGALLFLLVLFVKWWDPLFLVSCMVLLGLFTLSSVLYLIEEGNELFVLDSTAAAASDGDFAPEHDWEAGHRLASSPAERTGEQATGRVDVPGEAHNGIFKQKVAAASLTAASQQTHVLTAWSVGSPLEKWEKDNPVSRIFVRDLMGKSVSLRSSKPNHW